MTDPEIRTSPVVPPLASASDRVESLIASSTLDQKLAQLVGLWAGALRTDGVAPMQERLLADEQHFETFARDGLGQLTRHYGTTPIEAGMARGLLAERQQSFSEQQKQVDNALVLRDQNLKQQQKQEPAAA